MINKKKIFWLIIGSLMFFLTIISAAQGLIVNSPSKIVTSERLINGSIIIYDLKEVNDLIIKPNNTIISFHNQRLFDDNSLIVDYFINNSYESIGFHYVNVSLISDGDVIDSFLIKIYFQNSFVSSLESFLLKKVFLGLNILETIIFCVFLLTIIFSNSLKNFFSLIIRSLKIINYSGLIITFFLMLIIITTIIFFNNNNFFLNKEVVVKELLVNDYVNQGPGFLVITRDNRTPSFADYVTFSNGFQKDYFVVNKGSEVIVKKIIVTHSDLLRKGDYYFLVNIYDDKGLLRVVPFKVVV